ncbi:MAG: alpha/beta hydrolase [Myxococcota bacterium]|jgi:pimeloyl-ACP methyl ester carboxylesterase|nr:alpha/beta hydrolase [Myxococcota bacterium]
MRRILLALALAFAALIALPPLYYVVFPAPVEPLAAGDRMIPVGDGVSVSAIVRGHGEPVVLVHGLPGSGHDWALLTESLASRNLHVIAYDRVGYGNSDARKNGEFTLDGSARDLLGLLESEGLTDVTVVGWSYGGGTAIRAARMDPSRIGRLVLVGSAGYWPDVPDDPAIASVLFSAPVLGWVAAVPPVGRAAQAASSGQAFGSEAIPDWWLPTLASNFASPNTLLTYREEAAAMAWGENLDTSPIDLPIMVIHGQDDLLVPIEVAHLLVEAAPRAELVVIDGASHMLPVTQVPELTERVASFVHEHSAQ